jgi:magnesium and cobalt transporter
MNDDNGHSPQGIKERLRSFFGKRADRTKEALLEKDLQELIDQGEEQGLLTPEQGDMIQSIFEFKETVVREVMVPRTEMVAVQEGASIQAVIDLTVRHGHSRLPIYKDHLDNIVGMLHVKDLLLFWALPLDRAIPAEIIRQPYLVPETKKIVQLFKEMKAGKVHMAIVLDEYGGTAGLVTMEDIIEEIIGEIEDEYDRQEPRLKPLAEGKAEVDARLEIEELEKYFDLEIQEKDFESVGGLIIHLLGSVPKPNETVYFRDLKMTILDADSRRIRRVLVERSEEPSEELLIT